MTGREQEEYNALRATIRERGTARAWIFVTGVAVWAALGIAVMALALPPIVTVVPLLVLTATFEAVFALHVGVERIGRYLLVFHGDTWERAAGDFGRPAGTPATDALFVTPVLLATLVNLIPLLVTTPVAQELIAVVTAHLAFVARVVAARRAAMRQRKIDTERFQHLKQP